MYGIYIDSFIERNKIETIWAGKSLGRVLPVLMACYMIVYAI